jgi:phosphatidate cytidylyltransferase
MLRTRLVVGSALAVLMLGALFLDDRFAPSYPILFVTVALIGALSCHELLGLIPYGRRPSWWLCQAGVLFIIAANWSRYLDALDPTDVRWPDPWRLIVVGIAAVVLLAFLREMIFYKGPGESMSRVAFSGFATVYLGVLASFLIQHRWLPALDGDSQRATHALVLTIFVPKCCDIGAYLTGRALGKHRMTPLLSSKKTWEGAAGGIVLAVIVALAGSWLGRHPELWFVKAALYGITVGVAGMLGDLAESMIKREGQKKDASQSVPGFGGVLDVVDSLLFAAPVSYLWFTTTWATPL